MATRSLAVASSDANRTLGSTNLSLFSSTANRVVLKVSATQSIDSTKSFDCSKAFVDFPGIDRSSIFGTTWASLP